jgi:hypothetical protein
MAITVITTLSTERICLNPSEGRCVDGILAGNYVPGTVVVLIAGVWTAAVSGTAAHKLMKWGVVGYEKRVRESTNAELKITDAWDTSEAEDKRVPIWTSGFLIARIDDLNADHDAGTGVMVGTNAGILCLQDNAQIDMASLAINYKDNDVFTIIGAGEFSGQYWGGHN